MYTEASYFFLDLLEKAIFKCSVIFIFQSFEFNSFLKALFYSLLPRFPLPLPSTLASHKFLSQQLFLLLLSSFPALLFSLEPYTFFLFLFLYSASVISIPLFSNSMPSPSFGNWFNSARSHWYSSSTCFGNVAKELIDFFIIFSRLAFSVWKWVENSTKIFSMISVRHFSFATQKLSKSETIIKIEWLYKNVCISARFLNKHWQPLWNFFSPKTTFRQKLYQMDKGKWARASWPFYPAFRERVAKWMYYCQRDFLSLWEQVPMHWTRELQCGIWGWLESISRQSGLKAEYLANAPTILSYITLIQSVF